MPALTIQLDIDAAAVDSALTDCDVPILSSAIDSTNRSAIFSADSGSGADVWFSSDAAGSSPIDAKLVTWSDGSSYFRFDVEVASLSDSVDTTIYLHVGSKPGGYGTNPYDASTVGRWPMIANFNDFGPNGINATANGGLSAGAVTGPDGVLPASQFDGTDDYASVADGSTGVDVAGDITMGAWVYCEDPRTLDVGVVAKYETGTSDRSYRLAVRADERVRMNLSADGSANTAIETAASAVGVGSWHHIAGVGDAGARMDVFVDGASAANTTTGVPASLYNSAADFWIGLSVSTDPGDDQFFLGRMAGAFLDSTNRPAAYIKLKYLLEGASASTYITATDVTAGGGGGLARGSMMTLGVGA